MSFDASQKPAPLRPGAGDAFELPSLENGKPVPHRKPRPMSSHVPEHAVEKSPRHGYSKHSTKKAQSK